MASFSFNHDSDYVAPLKRCKRDSRSSQKDFLNAIVSNEPTYVDLELLRNFLDNPYFILLAEKRVLQALVESEFLSADQELGADNDVVLRGLSPSLAFHLSQDELETVYQFLDAEPSSAVSIEYCVLPQPIPEDVSAIVNSFFSLQGDMRVERTKMMFKHFLDIDFFNVLLNDISFLAGSGGLCDLQRTPILIRQDALKDVSIGIAKTSYGHVRLAFSGHAIQTFDPSLSLSKQV